MYVLLFIFMYNILSNSPVFRGLSSDKISELLQNTHFQVKKYNSNEIVSFVDEKCEHLFIIIEGRVTGEMVDSSLKTLKIEEILPPRPLAPAFIFGEENYFPVTIKADINSVILKIEKNDFLKLLQLNEIILINYLNLISNKAQFLSEKMRFIALKTIRKKIAYYILKQLKNNELILKLKTGQQEMAALFGIERPSLARAFKELKEEGILELKNRQISIFDIQQLKKLAGN